MPEPYWRVKDVLPFGYAVEDPEGTEFSDWDSWHKPTAAEAQAVADRLNTARSGPGGDAQ